MLQRPIRAFFGEGDEIWEVWERAADMYLREFLHETQDYKIIIEDDDRVAYAYLFKAESIVSDVWLYNVVPVSEVVGWEAGEEPPFLNPSGFSFPFSPPFSETDHIMVSWRWDEQERVVAEVYARNQLYAVLVEGVRPGWSRSARKDGPLARMSSDNGRLDRDIR